MQRTIVISYRATLRPVYGESVARYCGSSGVHLNHLSIERRIFLEIARIQVHAAVASLNGQKFCYRNLQCLSTGNTYACHPHTQRPHSPVRDHCGLFRRSRFPQFFFAFFFSFFLAQPSKLKH